VLGNNNLGKNYNDSMECLKENNDDLLDKYNNENIINKRKSNNNKEIHSDVYVKKINLDILEKRYSNRDKVSQLLNSAKVNNFFK
jgi:hypothetical protein